MFACLPTRGSHVVIGRAVEACNVHVFVRDRAMWQYLLLALYPLVAVSRPVQSTLVQFTELVTALMAIRSMELCQFSHNIRNA